MTGQFYRFAITPAVVAGLVCSAISCSHGETRRASEDQNDRTDALGHEVEMQRARKTPQRQTAVNAGALNDAGVDTPYSVKPRPQRLEVVENQLAWKHSREPKDPIWSARAEAAFTRDLAAFARNADFRVLSVDCRTFTCRVALEWPDYRSFRAGMGALSHGVYEVNCGRAAITPQPLNSWARYRHWFYFECERARKRERGAQQRTLSQMPKCAPV